MDYHQLKYSSHANFHIKLSYQCFFKHVWFYVEAKAKAYSLSVQCVRLVESEVFIHPFCVYCPNYLIGTVVGGFFYISSSLANNSEATKFRNPLRIIFALKRDTSYSGSSVCV